MKAGSRGNQGGDWPWKGEKEIKNVREPPGSFLFWLGINYGLFILAFFTLGLFSENPRIAALNVALDGILCAVSLALNIRLFAAKYKTPVVGKIALLLVTLCFSLFIYFAFCVPENGLPPVLFQ